MLLHRTTAVAGLVLAASAGAPAGALAAANCTVQSTWGKSSPSLARAVVARVNLHRLAIHRAQVAIDPALTRAAVWKSLHMARYAYFDHDDPAPPVRRSPFRRMRDCGFKAPVALGENIAAGYPTVSRVIDGWLGSPGHRANIESKSFRLVGVGVGRRSGSPYGIYWTQDFGGATRSVGHPPVARADAARVAAGRTVRLGVLRNDTDADGDRLAISDLSTARLGRATIGRGGVVVYAARAGAKGTDTVRVLVQDARGMVARSSLRLIVG